MLDGAVQDTDTALSAGLTDTVLGALGTARGVVDTATEVLGEVGGQVASEFALL